MRTPFLRRVVVSLLMIAALIGSSLQPIVGTSILAQGRSNSGLPDRVSDPEVQISGPKVDASLERAPDPDKAVVADRAHPNWRTVYGTEAGRQLLPPRLPEVPSLVEGATPPLTGFWITRTLAGANGITAIAYAPDGRLFAGLNNGGLRVFGPNSSGVYGWTSITASSGGLPSNWVTSLAVFGGDLWVGTSGSGVGVYDLSAGTWISYTVANSPLPHDTINRLTPVANPNGADYIWISTNGGGAARFTPSRPLPTWNIINTVDGLPSNTVYDVAVDYDGTAVTTYFANYGGLTSWDGSTFTNSLGSNTSPSNCTFFYVRRVIVDRQDRVWVIPVDIVPETPQAPQADITFGVCRRTFNGFFYTWTRFSTISPGLPNNDVTDLSEDYAGRIWMSMQGGSGGGAVNDNGTWKIYTTTLAPLINNDLRRVLAVGEDVWWGHGGTNAFSVHSPNWLRFNNVPLGETPHSIFLEATRTWVGGDTKIAYTDGGAFTTLSIPGNTGAVTSFARDGNGDLWIGTSGSGVYRRSGVTFTPFTTSSGLPNNSVNALLSDQLGRIWAGTNNGLAMRAEAGYWLTFTTGTSGLVGNIVQALARDSSDRLWIGTTNGVSVYDLNGVGGAAWISYTTASGLPFNMVTGLTSDSAGNMWASTYGGGVAAFDPVGNAWTAYSTTLPHTQTMDIASDPAGLIWTSTMGGLSLRQGDSWSSFKVPQSALESHRLNDVAADADRTWVQGTAFLAARGVLTSPIGNFVPVISSFSPISASPGSIVIINGNYFDTRGLDFNVVKFPDMNHFPTLKAEVISVTTTSITVKVPLLASSGKLQVEANGLKSPLSAVEFKLKPKINSISPTCLSAGSELKISGLGFLDGSAAAYVTIGGGTERIADATDPTQIRAFIRPGDTSGQVRVRLLNGNQVIASQSVSIATIQIGQTKVQQSIEGERLIWGKRTLVQLGATSGGCSGAKITRATLKWNFNTGYTYTGAVVNFPGGKALPSSLPNFSLDNTVSLGAELNLAFLASDLNLPEYPFISMLTFFTGADVILRNNNVDVLTVNLAKSKFNFVDTAAVRRRFIAMKVTGDTSGEQDPNFDQNMYAGFMHVARMLPQQDGWYTGGRYSWLHDTPFWYSLSYKVKIAAEGGNQDEARGLVEDFLDPGGKYWAVALIDQMNTTGDSALGLSNGGWRTVLAVNGANLSGRLMTHELLHAFGFVDSGAANYQSSNVPGEDNHSKYNEGRWSDFSDCVSSRTYRQALADFTSSANKRIVRLLGDNAPKELITAACSDAAGDDQSSTAKSIISYSPNRNNLNTVLEPIDYREMLKLLCQGGGCPGYSSPAAFNSPIVFAGPAAASEVTRTLRLGGQIDANGPVTITISYVGVNDGDVTPQDLSGDHHLIVRDAGNAVLHDQVFALEESALSPHDRTVAHGSAAGEVNPHALFQLRVPFPHNAAQAELVHGGNVLWSKSVSANAPTVSVTAPNGGTFNAANPLNVTWTAGDVDGDALQFGLEYSADNGATWTTIAPYITGNGIQWTPGYITATNTARVRVRASDGFNTAFATSNAFVLTAQAPKAVILSPDEGAVFAEGEYAELQGLSLTNEGMDAGAFLWQVNGATVGATRTVTTPLTAIGVNTITLQVTANALNGSRSITVTVVPDYDRDGLPNDWESQYQLNPLDATDAAGDVDGDTLSNADEYALGTHPRQADTDGDGASDNTEIDAGTDPLDPASQPDPNPVLNVGSTSMGFTVNNYSPPPGSKTMWVSNGGGGVLSFSVTKDAPWLDVTPTSGQAPQELTVSANHSGLAIGTYQGHVTVSAPGVSGSPKTITVTLTIDSIPMTYAYLPIVLR
jgi:ligand-binding sensor domain-containing protein